MRQGTSVAILLVSVAALTACQMNGAVNPLSTEQGLYGKNYSIFYSPADHVGELLRDGRIDEASNVWNAQSSYFQNAANSGARGQSTALAAALTAQLSPEIVSARTAMDAVSWPPAQPAWPEAKTAVEKAQAALAHVDREKVLALPGLLPPGTEALRQRLDRVEDGLRRDAADQFRAFPPAREENFFAVYPAKVDGAAVFQQTRPQWVAALQQATPQAILGFRDRYKDDLKQDDTAELGRLYYRSLLAAAPMRGFPAMLTAATQTREAGLPLQGPADDGMRVVEIARGRGGEFSVTFDNDLPATVEQADIEQALSGNADVVVLLDASGVRNDRRIRSYEAVASEYESGTRSEPNPDYSMAQVAVSQAQLDLQNQRQRNNVNSLFCQGWGCLVQGIASGLTEAAGEAMVGEAARRMANTPMMLTIPIYTPYQFNKATIDAAKVGTVNYYIVDRRQKTFSKGSFTVNESRSFVVAYGVHDKDRKHMKQPHGTDKEEAVVAYEAEGVTLPLSRVLAGYEGGATRRTLPGVADLRKEIGGDQARAAMVSQRINAPEPRADHRATSVVVVRHPDGGIGAGFYVREDMVLTNFHVIRDTQFVELKLHGGGETFGKVIARDPRLDLALIQVQARGTPLTFSNQGVAQGQNVEAIGHPKGLQFSLSRGVVSAVRDMPSRHTPGLKPVHVIQTDAAINPGNSGGPLLVGDKVVGVATWKIVNTETEGLGFAVHYSDVLEFLGANNIRPGT